MHVHNAFRAWFAVIVLGAIFVLAMAHVAVSDPASAYNCGDRGVVYCIVRYSYPNSRASETADPIGSALLLHGSEGNDDLADLSIGLEVAMSIHDRVARYAAAIWGDLSADEIDMLYEQLHRKGQRSIYISCNRAECSALANSFDQLFKRLGWPSTIGDGGILALGATGIEVNPNDDTARLLTSAIEERTKIKVDVSGFPRQPGDLNPTMLVIGPKPKYEKYFWPKPGDSDIGTGAEAGAADVMSPVADELQDP
jgi:hypothetical protein